MIWLCFFWGFCDLTYKCSKAIDRKSTFGKINLAFKDVETKVNVEFKSFLKSFHGILRSINKQFFGYHNNNSIYFYNLATKKSFSIKFDVPKDDKIQVFSCDDKYIYVKFRFCLKIYDFNCKEIASYDFPKNRETAGREMVIEDYLDDHKSVGKMIYLFTHNRDVFILFFNQKNNSVDLTYHQNDFYFSHNYWRFNFYFDENYIYIFSGKRFSVIDKLTGHVLKNIYLKASFDRMLVVNNYVILYSKMRFAAIDLNNNHELTYNEKIKIFGKDLEVKGYSTIYDGKTYDGKYIFTYLFKDIFFQYSVNTYDSKCLLIKKGKVHQFILKDFNISYVFETLQGIALVDTKLGKIYWIN